MWLSTDTKTWEIALPEQTQWQFLAQKVAASRAYIRARSGQRWLLQQAQWSDFCVWLMALLCENKTPILPSNGQPETLNHLRQFADQVAPTGLVTETDNESVTRCLQGRLQNEIVLYTSGSSGDPKAVHKTLQQLFNEVSTLEQTFGQSLGDCDIVTTITHQHIYGLLFTVLWPLCAGRNVVPQRIEYPEQWHQYHAQNPQAYAFVSTPAHLDRFTQVTTLGSYQRELRAVFSSGGPLADDVPARFVAAHLTPPIEVYGSTETGGIAWRKRHTSKQSFQVFNAVTATTDVNQHLQIRSPHLPNLDWYITSDKVTFQSPTSFVIHGRADRIVKLAEKRLSLDEVEAFVETLEYVEQAKCCILEGQQRDELGLVIVLTDDGQQHLQQLGRFGTRQAIRQHLAQRFESVVLPRKFRYVTQMPYNDAGKITQHALSQLFVEGANP